MSQMTMIREELYAYMHDIQKTNSYFLLENSRY